MIPICDAGELRAQDLDRAAVREQQVVRSRERVGIGRRGPARDAPSRSRPTPTTHGSLCVIQWPTRSPSRSATASAYSANASTVSRAGQPPASSSACGMSQWKSVTYGAIPLPSSSSTSRS